MFDLDIQEFITSDVELPALKSYSEVIISSEAISAAPFHLSTCKPATGIF